MRVPLSLLRSFVPVAVPLDQLALRINARVSEVESVERPPSRQAFSGVVGVRLVAALEQRDGHTRWQIEGGQAIVVGDKFGVVAGQVYAAVLAGSALPDGTAVGARTVAGLASEGMLVSEAMLGIGKEAARPVYFSDVPASTYDALELDDAVLVLDLEPNRPDLYSLAGVARDVSAIWGLSYSKPPRADVGGLPEGEVPLIRLQSPRARRYEAVLVEGVTVAASPQWLQNAVRKLGMRSINNVVDAANLVMLETGQPLHTFNANALQSGEIVLRMATPGESITTLDGVARELTDECLLVCDGARPVAIAGVMGNADSEVQIGTTRVLIEGAAFDMACVRRASRRLSLRTEASTRFEKGLPLCTVREAIERLVYLLTEVAGGRAVAQRVAGIDPPANTTIVVDRSVLLGRLGLSLPDDQVDAIFRGLGFGVVGNEVVVPETRPDVKIPEDLVEEIGRIHGYEHVPSTAPAMPLVSPRDNPVLQTARRLRRVLGAVGWDEVYLPCWIGNTEVARFNLDRSSLIALLNPIAENYAYFRPTALPALCEAAEQNRKELTSFAIYEVGRVYSRNASGAIVERSHAAGITVGTDLLAVRDALLEFAGLSGLSKGISRPEHPHFHPGRSLAIGAWAQVGELHPRLVRELGFREAPIAFSLDLEGVASSRAPVVRYAPPSRFPVIDLDLNVEVPARVESAALLVAVPEHPLLQRASVRDVYGLPVGSRVTLSFRFGSAERSLAIEEANQALDTVRFAMRERGWVPA